MHNTVALAHGWLDGCLLLLSASSTLCVRLRLLDRDRVERIRVGCPAPRLSPESSPRPASNSRKWEPLRDAAPRLLAEGIPTLRYVAVSSSGHMARDTDDPGGSSFRESVRWWRVVSGVVAEKRAVELIEISAEEGQRLDEYMRGEAFANTLQL
ncbi:uncharacterized protein B0H18DRAFT_676775 [Fomitopsis serialis]|uniref:uncharacterized protein n=1 Tax=Fomitopsis serialis TaxID=139415 RepID=UPI0020074653|nr:uncharacterized protein B0H18DRAFT_676775 [Neoantrodia serialis]KAH9918315.1 hypothetical protein B0H18DRAFT_676775 [Neoantrodia serialis]